MNQKLVHLLVCPECKCDLAAFAFSKKEERVIDGVLRCTNCTGEYMIVGGIPRMLPSSLYRNDDFLCRYQTEIQAIRQGQEVVEMQMDSLNSHKKRTIESFQWQWHTYNRFGYDDPTFHIERERQRFFDNTLFSGEDIKNKRILDGGCGNGRYSLQCVLQGAEVVGIDLSAAVEDACQNLQGHPNASFVQADMFKLPFRPGIFDMAFSIGVLMHTGDAQKAFTSLAGHVKPGGHVGIGVYQKQNPLHEFNDRWLRAFSIHFSPAFLKDLAHVLAKVANAAWKIRMLGLINAFFRLEPYELCIYDWYKAPVATHHTYAEVESWFRAIHMADIRDDRKRDQRDFFRKWLWPRCGLTMRGQIPQKKPEKIAPGNYNTPELSLSRITDEMICTN